MGTGDSTYFLSTIKIFLILSTLFNSIHSFTSFSNAYSWVKKLILDLHKDKKPLGAICIAPALIGLVLGDKGVEVNIGDDKETAQEIEKTGAKHFSKKVNEIHVDEKNKVVSTPAYMYGDARLTHISQGIRRCVEKVLDLA